MAACLAASVACVQPASAAEPPEAIFAATGAPPTVSLANFSTTNGTVFINGPIGGLGANEDVVSMDFRPATGQLYALTNDLVTNADEVNRIDGIHTATPTAVPVATLPTITGATDMDFNPSADLIRIVATTGENVRVNPASASVTIDAPLNGAAASASGAAYANNAPGAQQTTLYDIDGVTLYHQGGLQGSPTPNGGTLSNIGTIAGTTALLGGGFDISPNSGRALSLRDDAGTRRLIQVDLRDGSAETVITPTNVTTRAIAILPKEPVMSFSASSQGVAEDAGSVVLTVRRAGNITLGPSFSYTVTPGTADSSDFGTASPAGPITFAPGETTKTITVPIANDGAVEGDETFTVTLGSALNGVIAPPTVQTVTIFDDDPTNVTETVTEVVTVTVTRDQVLLIDGPTSIKRKSLARGLRLRASCAEACEVSYELRLGSKLIGTAAGSSEGAGVHEVTLRLSKDGAEALVKAFKRPSTKKRKLTLSGVATDSDGGQASTSSARITVIR